VFLGPSDDAIALAIDGAYVYWQTPGGSVYASSLGVSPGVSGTLLSSLVGSSSVTLEALTAANGIAVFLAGGNAIASVAYASPTNTTTLYEGTPGSLGAIATDGSQVYFVESLTTDGGASTTGVYSCPLTGPCSSPALLYSNPGGDVALGPMFVAAGEVYFVEVDFDDANGGRLLAVSTTGGTAVAPLTLCGSDRFESGIPALAVAGGFAYFTSEEDSNSIYQCATDGSAVNPTRYIEDYAPYGLATDGTLLYWTNYVPVTGTVATCAIGATCTAPSTVASNVDAPYAIAANAMSVFWTTPETVYRADR
jgi:hypothetical protein